MTPEQRLEKLEQQVLHLKARLLMQTAEQMALKALLEPLAPILTLPLHASPKHPSPLDPSTAAEHGSALDALYLSRRNELIQRLLLQLEHTDPALAARLTELLQSPGLNFPLEFG